jgi:hypothetical protein
MARASSGMGTGSANGIATWSRPIAVVNSSKSARRFLGGEEVGARECCGDGRCRPSRVVVPSRSRGPTCERSVREK